MAPEGVDVEIDGRQLRAQQPRQGAVSRGRVHQGRGHRLLRAHRPGDAPAHRATARSPSGASRTASTHRRSSRSGARSTDRHGCRPQVVRATATARSSTAGSTSAPPSCGPATWRRSSCTRRWRGQTTSRRPTMVVFDLDPGAPATIVECARGRPAHPRRARQPVARGVREDVGSKGLQLYVPLNTPATHEGAGDFALAVGQLLEQRPPEAGHDGHAQGPARRARSSSTGARTPGTRRRSRPTPCEPGPTRRCRRRCRGTRSRRARRARRRSCSRPRMCSNGSTTSAISSRQSSS